MQTCRLPTCCDGGTTGVRVSYHHTTFLPNMHHLNPSTGKSEDTTLRSSVQDGGPFRLSNLKERLRNYSRLKKAQEAYGMQRFRD